jgi:DNA-binding HxlR family transcriptional regulator
MMKRANNKSHCPINYSLEVFGDTWSLLIIRDIVFFGKKTFGEFLDSEEKIATNILTQRLKHLEQKGILTKKPHPADKRKEVYELTEKGLGIIPILLEMGGWGATHDPETTVSKQFVNSVYADRYGMFDLIRKTIQRGGSVFVGDDSVVNQMSKPH